MPRYDTVAIIGVGLIGGSIGLALRRRRLTKTIVGIGRRRSSLAKAQDRGCVTKTSTSIARGVVEADLIVVCTPVEQIAEQVIEAAACAGENAVITDAGSTKEGIVHTVESAMLALENSEAGGPQFVGSHPIAGSEKTGPEAARHDLFKDRVTVVTPTERSDPAAVAKIEEFWQALGSRVVRLDPYEHDQLLARTSHLPHLVASALAATTPGNGHSPTLVGSGWSDTTRIAAGDPEIWKQIFLANSGHTLSALTAFETLLKTWRKALESADGPLLLALLREGKRQRDAVGS